MAISLLPPNLTLEQKAKLKQLDGMLSIKDIALLRHKDDEDLIKPYAYEIAEACLTGELDFHHDVRAHDLRWLYDHPETETILELPLDYETSPWPGSEEYSDINSAWCLESEWSGDPHPKPAYKYNDNSAKLKRLYTNNHNSSAYDLYRHDYAMGGRCLISAEAFKEWLIKKHDYPLPENCLLANWFETEEAQATNGADSQNRNSQVVNYFYGDVVSGDKRMGDDYIVKNIDNKNGNLNIGKDNHISSQRKSENIFQKPWFYIGVFGFIYVVTVAVMAYDLRQRGMLGNKTFKEIVSLPLLLVKDTFSLTNKE